MLVVTTPSGATSTSPITVEHGQPSLHAVLTVPGALRYGWVGRATLSLRNAGANDVGIEAVRFARQRPGAARPRCHRRSPSGSRSRATTSATRS